MSTATQKRITLATIKSFIRKNRDRLLISTRSRFDGMTDGCEPCRNKEFRAANLTENHPSNTLGIAGAWFVGGSRNSFQAYSDDTYTGYEVYNSCGTFILAVKSS